MVERMKLEDIREGRDPNGLKVYAGPGFKTGGITYRRGDSNES